MHGRTLAATFSTEYRETMTMSLPPDLTVCTSFMVTVTHRFRYRSNR